MHGDGANTAQTEPSFLLHLPSLSLSHRCTHEKCCGKESAKFQQGVWCVWWKWSELIERLVTQKLSPNSQLQLYITREGLQRVLKVSEVLSSLHPFPFLFCS